MMDFASLLKSKNIHVKEIPKGGPDLRKQWEHHFAGHLSEKEKRAIYLRDRGGCCGFLWHVFSYGKRKCLKGEEANKAFNEAEKRCCYVFYQHSDDAFLLENASALTAADFAGEIDVYVVDQKFAWTYVITHETGWLGPYFSRKEEQESNK